MAKPVVVNIGIDDILSDQLEAGLKALPRIAAQMESVGAAMSRRITSVLTAIAAPAMAAAADQAVVVNSLRITTGAAGDQLAALENVVDAVRAGTGAGVADSAGVVGDLSVQLGLTGDALKSAAASAVRYARASGQDLHAVTEGIIHVMQAWHEPAGSFEDTAALLQAAGRDASGGMVEMSDALTQYEPTLKLANLSLKDAAALLAQLAHYGVSTETAMAGLSKAILGFAKGGSTDIGRDLALAFDEMRRFPTDSAATGAAVQLFGKKAPAMAEAIRRGRLTLTNIEHLVIPDSKPLETLSRAFAKLQQQLEIALKPLGKSIAAVLRSAIEPLHLMVDALADIVKMFAELPVWARDTIIILGAMAAALGPLLLVGGLFIKAAAAIAGAVGLMGGLQIVAAGALIASAIGLFVSFEGVHEKLDQVISSAKDSVHHVGDVFNPEMLKGFEPPQVSIAINATIATPPPMSAFAIPTLPAPTLPSARLVVPGLSLPAIGPNQPFPPIPAGQPADAGSTDPRAIAAAYASQASGGDAGIPFPAMPNPRPGVKLSDAYLAQIPRVRAWWQYMQAHNLLPPGPYMPGSFLAMNTPEMWAEFAAKQALIDQALQNKYGPAITDYQRSQQQEKADYAIAHAGDAAKAMYRNMNHGVQLAQTPSYAGGVKYTVQAPQEAPFPVASFPAYSEGDAPVPMASGGIVGGSLFDLGSGVSFGIGGPAGPAQPPSLGVVAFSAIVSSVKSAISALGSGGSGFGGSAPKSAQSSTGIVGLTPDRGYNMSAGLYANTPAGLAAYMRDHADPHSDAYYAPPETAFGDVRGNPRRGVPMTAATGYGGGPYTGAGNTQSAAQSSPSTAPGGKKPLSSVPEVRALQLAGATALPNGEGIYGPGPGGFPGYYTNGVMNAAGYRDLVGMVKVGPDAFIPGPDSPAANIAIGHGRDVASTPAASSGAVQAASYAPAVINDNRGWWPAGTPLTSSGTPIALLSQKSQIAPEAWPNVVWATSIIPPGGH